MSMYLSDHRYMRRMMFAHFLTPSVLRDEIEEIRWRVFADDIEDVCWRVFVSKTTASGGIFTGGTGFNTIKAISKIRRAVDGDGVLIPGKMNLPGTTATLPVP